LICCCPLQKPLPKLRNVFLAIGSGVKEDL
jgi:hypothetical protein